MAQVRGYLSSVLRTQQGPLVEGDPGWLFLARSCLLSCPPSCPGPHRPPGNLHSSSTPPLPGVTGPGTSCFSSCSNPGLEPVAALGCSAVIFLFGGPACQTQISIKSSTHPGAADSRLSWGRHGNPTGPPSLQGAFRHTLAGSDQALSQVWALVSPWDYEK